MFDDSSRRERGQTTSNEFTLRFGNAAELPPPRLEIQNRINVTDSFSNMRKILILLVCMAVLQMILIAPVYNREAENLFWASRTDSCPGSGGDFTFEWYSYRYCVALDGDVECFDYPDDEEDTTSMLAEASRAYPACMALATLAMFLSVVETIIIVGVWLTSRSDDIHVATRLGITAGLAAAYYVFLVVNSICIAAVAGANRAQTGENDFFGDVFWGCGSDPGPDETELGYGAAVHIGLVVWFIVKAVVSVFVLLFSLEVERKLRDPQPSQPSAVEHVAAPPRAAAVVCATEEVNPDDIEMTAGDIEMTAGDVPVVVIPKAQPV